MGSISYGLRAAFWFAAVLLGANALFFDQGTEQLGYFLMMSVIAGTFTWIDNEYIGRVIHFGSLDAPAPDVWDQATTDGSFHVCNGTYYHPDTPETVVDVLEDAIEGKRVVGITYLDGRTATGRIRHAYGAVPIPELIRSVSPHDAEPIFDHLIVRVLDLSTGTLLFDAGLHTAAHASAGPVRTPRRAVARAEAG